jgi:hypothetical protein
VPPPPPPPPQPSCRRSNSALNLIPQMGLIRNPAPLWIWRLDLEIAMLDLEIAMLDLEIVYPATRS